MHVAYGADTLVCFMNAALASRVTRAAFMQDGTLKKYAALKDLTMGRSGNIHHSRASELKLTMELVLKGGKLPLISEIYHNT